MENPFLSIIIPARNEERCLSFSLEKIILFLNKQKFKTEVLVVVNDCTDKTMQIAVEFSRRCAAIRVITEELPGKGRAVRKGMLAARGAYRFFTDADLSLPIDEVLRFLPPEVDAPVVIASREVPGAMRYNEPFYRRVTGRVFNVLMRLVVLPGLYDSQCGFKMFRADAAEDLFSRQTLTGWSFDVELLCIAGARGYSIREVPVSLHYNSENNISILQESWPMLRDLFKIRRNKRQGLYHATAGKA
jgi:dolichyl-phosphate beta-glucosyltransferase